MYSARPVLCRTQGYPLLYRSGADGEEQFQLSHCERNFTGREEFSPDFVIDMDRVNLALAAVNIHFLKSAGRYEQCKDLRISMDEIAGMTWPPPVLKTDLYNH